MLLYNGKHSPLDTPELPKIISDEPIKDSQYIELRRITFQEEEKTKIWDIAKSHNSVAVLLYEKEMQGFVFVRQFRVSVFLKNPKHGYIYELCAGLCDKDNKSVEQTTIEEIEEECGYRIETSQLCKINEFYSSVGMNGALQNLFYAQIDSKDRVNAGGGNKNENENIELVFVPRNLIHEFLDDENCPKAQSLCYAVLWFEKYEETLKNSSSKNL
ncbi:NUDIX hydrolase [Helicobacter didelphidarum]|uniref:NUDIX hydrolase n=1 Tax=Helicobacter didelphidarum TaxID=2040648 RepID=A0A3D8IJF4_9HELI|nr:NUDIX domain-containing protein [Helicobacter didelphidarum]RDU65288.1 NUDIX hydrolase [Helicobacter didelphidarum]